MGGLVASSNSNKQLRAGPLVINDVIYAEISTRYATVEGVDAMLRNLDINVAAIPRSALFLAGKAYLRYRSAGGLRTGVLRISSSALTLPSRSDRS